MSVAEQIGRAAQALSLSSISAVEKGAVATDGGGEDGAVGGGRAGDGEVPVVGKRQRSVERKEEANSWYPWSKG